MACQSLSFPFIAATVCSAPNCADFPSPTMTGKQFCTPGRNIKSYFKQISGKFKNHTASADNGTPHFHTRLYSGTRTGRLWAVKSAKDWSMIGNKIGLVSKRMRLNQGHVWTIKASSQGRGCGSCHHGDNAKSYFPSVSSHWKRCYRYSQLGGKMKNIDVVNPTLSVSKTVLLEF
jgi:hypothetical protein